MASNLKTSPRAWGITLGLVIFCLPLVLTLIWNEPLADKAYSSLQSANTLAAGNLVDLQVQDFPQNPLYIGLLALFGLITPAAAGASKLALLISALGWSVTAAVVLLALRALQKTQAGAIAAVLIASSPLITATAGTEYAWMLALGWTALALHASFPPANRGGTRDQKEAAPDHSAGVPWIITGLLLLLMLGLHFDLGTWLFVLILLATDIYGRSRSRAEDSTLRRAARWLPLLLLLAATFAGGFYLLPRYGFPPGAVWGDWRQGGQTFLSDHPLYWLFTPFILVGVYAAWTGQTGNQALPPGPPGRMRSVLGLAAVWVALAFLSRSLVAPAIASVLALVMASLGVAWISERILASDRLTVDQERATILLPGIFTISLLLVNFLALWMGYQVRPWPQYALQEQAAAWLRANSDPGAVVYGPSRIGYLAERPNLPAEMGQLRDDNVRAVYDRLLAELPDYIVAEQTLPWDYVTRSTWFKQRYAPRAVFDDAYAVDGPVTIWGYQPSPYDRGETVQVSAIIDDRLALVGYKFEPQVIVPGDDIYLTLYLQALQPVGTGFLTGIHLTAADGWIWAWKEEQTPRSLPGEWWEPGQVIPERFLLETTADIPLGAYDLQVFWRSANNKEELPLFRDEDENVLDRVHLGYVIAPPEVDDSQAVAVGGRYGDEIRLQAIQLNPEAPVAPGELLEVALFWEALRRPAANYTVFVHLVDSEGTLVAASDSMPVENRFPTGAFAPGVVVEDRHQLALPADLPAGSYQLVVGLYHLETGERLPVWDADGLEQVDRALPVLEVEVGN